MKGSNMKKRRQDLGLKPQDLALRLGTTKTTIYRWESETNEPDDFTKQQLANALNTSISYLMGETDDPAPYSEVSASLHAYACKTGKAGTWDLNHNSPFSERLRNLREKRGLSISSLAELTGIKDDILLSYEEGTCTPRRDYILALSEKLGVSKNYLVGETDNPSTEYPIVTTGHRTIAPPGVEPPSPDTKQISRSNEEGIVLEVEIDNMKFSTRIHHSLATKDFVEKVLRDLTEHAERTYRNIKNQQSND